MPLATDLVVRPFKYKGSQRERGDRIQVDDPLLRDQLIQQGQIRRLEAHEQAPPLSENDTATRTKSRKATETKEETAELTT